MLACLAIALGVVLTRDPDEAWAVAVLILALGAASGAFATLLALRPGTGARKRTSRGHAATAARRGVEIGAVVALLLWLRVVDGLSPITAAFVITTFVVTESLLSARPQSSR
jgi:hypothetical protein